MPLFFKHEVAQIFWGLWQERYPASWVYGSVKALRFRKIIASGFVLLNELCGQVRTAIFMLLWEQILLKSSNLTASPVSLFSQIQTALLVLEAVPDACLSAEEIKHLFQQYKSIWERDIPSTRRLVCTAGSEMTATAACSLSYWAKVSSSIWLK